MDTIPPKTRPQYTGDLKTEANSLISDYPPDPPKFDRFTKILAKTCGVLAVLVAIVFIFGRNRPAPVAPVVESSVAPQIDSSPKKFGFPTVAQFKGNTEAAQKPQIKAQSKSKAKAKMASKKPVKKS